MATATPDEPAPSVSPEPKPEDNIQTIKERVINTSKLLKIFKTKEQELTQAKKDILTIQAQLSTCNAQIALSTKELNFFKADSDKSHKEVTRLAQLLATRESELYEIKREAEDTKSQLETTRAEMQKASVKLRSVEMLKAQLEAEVQENAPSKSTIDKMKKDMAKLQKEIETKDEACKKNLKEISDLKAERKEENSKARAAEKEKFKAEKEKFKAEKDGLQAEVNALQTDKENAEQKIMELELDNTLMRDALDNSKQDFDKLQCELDEWKANTTSGEVQQLQDQTRRLEGEKRQTQKHVERLNQLVEDLREQLSRANGDLETQAPEKETLKAQNNTLTKELDAAKSMITKLKAQAQKGKGKVTEVSPPPPANDHLDAIHAELQAAKNIINKQKGEIAALKRAKDGFDGEGGEALRTEVELLRQENEHLVKAKRVLQDTYTDHLIQISELKEVARRAAVSPSGKTQTREPSVLREGAASSSVPEVSKSYITPVRRTHTSALSTRANTVEYPVEHATVPEDEFDVAGEALPLKPKRTRRTKAQIEKDREAKETAAREKLEAKRKRAETPKEPVKRTRRKTVETALSTPVVIDHSKYIADKFKDLSVNPRAVIASVGDLELFATTKIDLLLSSLEDHFRSLITRLSVLVEHGNTGTRLLTLEGHPTLEIPTCVPENEANLMLFLWALANKFPNTKLLDSLLVWAAETIILKTFGTNDLEYIGHICRVFVVLCRAVGALQRVRVFCFDLMREPIENSHLLLLFVNVAIMWPETLSHPAMPDGADTGLGQNLILRTFESILAGIHEDCEKPSTVGASQLYGVLETHCRWSKPKEAPYLDDIIKEVISVLRLPEFQARASAEASQAHFMDYRFNLVKSIELAVYYHGEWEYLYEHIISNVLWPLMKDGHVVDMSLEIIGVLGRSSLLEEEEKTGIHALRQKMEDVLNLGHDVDQADFILQIHAARSLFLLVNGEIKYLTGLFKWYREIREPNRWQLPPSLVRDVEYLRDLR